MVAGEQVDKACGPVSASVDCIVERVRLLTAEMISADLVFHLLTTLLKR